MTGQLVRSIRLPADLAEQVAIVADCDGEPVIETIRAALRHWVALRRADALVQEALQRRIERTAALLMDEPASAADVDAEAIG